MTNFDRIRRMDADKMTAFIDAVSIGDIDWGMTFCSDCEPTKESGMSCEKCIKWWLELDTEDGDYFCVDFRVK